MRRIILSILVLLALCEPLLAFEAFPDTGVVAKATASLDGNYKPVGTIAKGTVVSNLLCLSAVDICLGTAAGADVTVKGSDLAVIYGGQQLDAHAAKLAFDAALASVSSKPVASASSVIWTEGDSYMAGAYTFALTSDLASLTTRTVTNTALGGSDMAGIVARMTSPTNKPLASGTVVIWDGSDNGLTSVGEYAGALQKAIEADGITRFVILPPAVAANATSSDLEDKVAAEFKRRWPDNYLDWRPLIGNANGLIDSSLFADFPKDNWHLNGPPLLKIANAIMAFIRAKDW